MSKTLALSQAQTVEEFLASACASNASVELHYLHRSGSIIIGRARLLEITDKHLMADRPLCVGDSDRIPCGASVTVHLSLGGNRYQFDSVVEATNQLVRLNTRQHVPGIALRKPTQLGESQRRAHLRIALVGYDPISVSLAPSHPKIANACAINAPRVPAWMFDLSVGGMSVLLDRNVLRSVKQDERFFTVFSLPCTDEDFYMLAAVRHSRVVEASDSLRIGLTFRPWLGTSFSYDQRRISQFIVGHERRFLRQRRK